MTSRHTAVAVLSGLMLLAGCAGVGTEGSTGGYVSGSRFVTYVEPEDREDAPVLSGEDLEGEPISSEEHEGQTIVVNVWGSWCPPCRAEAPVLNEAARTYADSGVQFLGLLVRDDPAAARAFERKQDTPYPSIVDADGRQQLGFADSLPSQAIPTTWVIDAEGRVAARIIDPELRLSTLTGVLDDVMDSMDEDGVDG
ncbi:TlpA family protein disulfide reductase [Aeromicrobium sp. CF4.19]|uniref:TlpA family protein disulfide reductase n=1 Tax=Aeromicrobium sp. CF4.19 TaxID=3373082 RepID=UPI003EE46F89